MTRHSIYNGSKGGVCLTLPNPLSASVLNAKKGTPYNKCGSGSQSKPALTPHHDSHKLQLVRHKNMLGTGDDLPRQSTCFCSDHMVIDGRGVCGTLYGCTMQ